MSDPARSRWLWITPEVTADLSTGALKYSHGLAAAVAATGVDVTMVGLQRPATAPPHLGPAGGSLHAEVIDAPFRPRWRSLVSTLPNQAVACSPPVVRSRVRQLLDDGAWAAVVIDGLQAAWVTPLLEQRRREGASSRVVHVAHNHETSMRRTVADEAGWTSPRRPVLELEAHKTRRLEQRTVRAADVVSSITENDRSRFEQEAPGRTHVVVPPGWDGPQPTRPIPADDRPRRVGILGSFDWHVKQESLHRFLRAADPVFADAGVELHVAGRMPDDFRRHLEPGLRATRLLGWVDDSTEYLAGCRVGVISESLGGGFKLKALDYVFNSVPLASLRSNVAGLPLVPGESAIIADDEGGLARAIVAAIDDTELLDRYASTALETCRATFSWQASATRLVDAVG